jgi:hypothetical protein
VMAVCRSTFFGSFTPDCRAMTSSRQAYASSILRVRAWPGTDAVSLPPSSRSTSQSYVQNSPSRAAVAVSQGSAIPALPVQSSGAAATTPTTLIDPSMNVRRSS